MCGLDRKEYGDEMEESEEWIVKIDRGGLVHVTNSMFQTVISAEYVIRQHLSATDGSFDKDVLLIDIVNDSDVLFHWCLATSDVDESDIDKAATLYEIASKYITIRGFSFTKSIMEKYHQDTKKSTKKSKPLRVTVAK